MKMRTVSWRKSSNFAIVAAYAVVVLALLPFHEPWRDEAWAWLLARDLGIRGIFHQTGYVGHPALWYLLQMPLAKGGAPYESVGALNALFAISAVAVLVYLSPFSQWQKLAFAASFPMVIVYGLVWRPYAMAILVLFLAAAAYRNRMTAPLRYALAVALLANCIAQTMGVALILTGIYLIECVAQNQLRGRRLWALGVMGAGLGAAVLQLLPPPDTASPGLFPFFRPSAFLALMAGGFCMNTHTAPNGLVCAAGFVVVLWYLRKRWDLFWLLVFTAAGWGYLFTFKYPLRTYWHMEMFAMMLVTALWINRADEPRPNSARKPDFWSNLWGLRTTNLAEVLVFGSLFLSAVRTVDYAVLEVLLPFSGAKETARYIRAQAVTAPIAAGESDLSLGLLPYLPGRQFYQLENRRFGTFFTPTQSFFDHKVDSFEKVAQAMVEAFPKEHPWLLLPFELPLPEQMGYKLVFTSAARTWGSKERFWLYKPVEEVVTPPGSSRPAVPAPPNP